MKWDAKNIAAVTGLIMALMGGVELRMAVYTMQARLDRIEHQLEQATRVASQ